jgi:uncharacterized protein YxeA
MKNTGKKVALRTAVLLFAVLLMLCRCKDLFHTEAPGEDWSAPSAPRWESVWAESSSSILLNWEPVSGANGYYVYRADTYYDTYSYITSTSYTSYTDTSLSSNTTYYYKVSAYNSYGESSQSSYTSATTSGSGSSAPSAPSSVTASAASSSSITVSWSTVSSVSGYYVYRAASSGGTYSYITSTTSASYTDTGLSSNTTYYYKVSAYNSYGEGSLSSYASAATSGSGSSASILLTAGAWHSASLSPGEVHYYHFSAYSGSNYTIYWNDFDYNSDYADIVVSATDNRGIVLLNEDVGYDGQGFYLSSSGAITLKVEGLDPSSQGPYWIAFERD